MGRTVDLWTRAARSQSDLRTKAPRSIGDETGRCLENLAAVCAAAGASLGDAVRLTVYTTEMASFAAINEVYESFFESDPPARVAIGVTALPRGSKVEIDAVVAIPG